MSSGTYYSREDWIRLVGKDAEGMITHPVFGEIRGNSFPHFEDLQDKAWPDLSSLQAPARSGGIVLNKNLGWFSSSHLRDLIRYSLIHGAEHLRFDLNPEETAADLSFLLEGVYLDMIRLSIGVSDAWLRKAGEISLASLKSLEGPLNLECDWDTALAFKDALTTILGKNNGISLTPVLELKVREADKWKEILSGARTKMEIIQSGFPGSRLVFRISLSDDFLTGICAIRAFRMLSTRPDFPPFVIEAGTDHSLLGTEPFANQIYQATAALASILGGAETVWMLPSDFLSDDPSQDWVRTAIHTMHILKQEAHLDLVRDPLEGSYYVEDLSSKILEHLIISFKP